MFIIIDMIDHQNHIYYLCYQFYIYKGILLNPEYFS